MTSILRTKIFTPVERPRSVQRTSLLEKLNSALERRLILVVAPAGFGKTALAISFVQQVDLPFSWLSLDKNDNELPQFARYLIEALQQIDPQIGHTSSILLQASPSFDSDELAISLVNDILAYGQHFVLVLDDFHVIENPEVHEFVRTLLRYKPAEMHLLLTSRTEPPLSLARLRVRNELAELRIEDLRFDLLEAESFLHQTMGVTLPEDDLQAITQRTEGWIAGLQLAALSLQGLPPADKHQFIQTLAGDDRYIFDYLLEEVLQRQPEEIQAFLVQTSILQRLCAPLCDAVMQDRESQRILQLLEKRNLFILPQDNRRWWYRYHQLFADILRYRLKEVAPDIVADLYLRACEWCAENDMVEDAVDYALDGGSYERASELIEACAHQVFGQGKLQRVVAWLNVLPDELLKTHAKLYLIQSWVLFRMGKFEILEAHLQHALQDNLLDASNAMRGEYLILNAHVSFLHGEFEQTSEQIEEGLALLPVDNLALRMPATAILGWSCEANGHLGKALRWFEEGLRMARQIDSLTGTVSTLGCMVGVYAAQGTYDRAAATFQEAVQYAQRRNSEQIPLLGIAYIGMGRSLQAQKKWHLAAEHLQQGIARCRRWGGLSIVTLNGFSSLADVFEAQGNATMANSVRAEARVFGQEQKAPQWAMAWLDSSIEFASLPEPLTRREREVLRLLSKGFSSIEIAEDLIIGVSTVRTHIKRIYSKLNVHSRSEAIAYARQLGFG